MASLWILALKWFMFHVLLTNAHDLGVHNVHRMNPLGLNQDLNLRHGSLSADVLRSTSSMMESGEAGLSFRSPKKRNRDMEIDWNVSNNNV